MGYRDSPMLDAADGRDDHVTSRRVTFGVVAVALVTTLVVQGGLLSSWVRYYVSEEQALLWAAARSWGRGHPGQPNFWGQAYGTTFEAIPAELLRMLGVRLGTGLPLAIIGLNLSGWAVMALAARWRVAAGWIAVAVAIPALLSADYLVLSVAYNTAVGRTMAGVAAAMTLTRWRPQVAPYVALACGALAVGFDNSTLLLVAPVAVYALGAIIASTRSWRGRIARLMMAGLVPGAWWVLGVGWYRSHPTDGLHPAPSFAPSLDRLATNLGHIGRFFSALGLRVAPGPIVPIIVIAALAIASVRSRQPQRLLGVVAVVGLTLVILSVPRADEWLPTAYYPAARVLLPLPMALWYLCIAEPRRHVGPPRMTRSMPIVIAGVCVLSAGVHIARWNRDVVTRRDQALAYPSYPLTEIAQLLPRCRFVAETAATLGVEFAAFDQRTDAYACAALEPSLSTVFPPYERRSWVMDDFVAGEHRFLLYTSGLPVCSKPAAQCEAVGTNLVLITGPAATTVPEMWLALGYPLRPGY